MTRSHKVQPRVPWYFMALLISPILVFWPILFAGYTICQSPLATNGARVYGFTPDNVVPVMDPNGSSLNSEPYLVYWKRNAAQGHIPLLNMRNGMGNPSMESLPTGTFYILNPVLFLLPTGKPLYYDLFQLLHVYILLIGLYFLLRLYVSELPAAVTAITVTLSGVTFVAINMENYRSFAWLPVMMLCAVRIAREERPRRYAYLLVFALVAGCSAGNIQEFAPDVFALCVVYGCEAVAARPRRWIVFPASAAAGISIASVSVLPFLAARGSGDYFLTNSASRSVADYDIVWVFSWILPKIGGDYPYLFLKNKAYWPHSDFSTTGFLLLLFGILFGWSHLRAKVKTAQVVLCLAIPVVIVCGLVKVIHFHFLDFFRFIPLVREFFFVKYHLYLFGLASLPIGIGLEHVIRLPKDKRRAFIRRGMAALLVIVAAVVWYLYKKPDYAIQGAPAAIRTKAFVLNWGVSAGVCLAIAALLYWMPRHWRKIVLGLVIVHSMCQLPMGYRARLEQYPPVFRGGESAERFRTQRILTSEDPNANLFFDVESLPVYDSMVNTHYRDFMLAFFHPAVNWADYRPTDDPLSPAQVEALQAAGTAAAFGYRTTAASLTRPLPDGFEILNPLPRVFAISEQTFRDLRETRLTPQTIGASLARIRADLKAIPQPALVRFDHETIRFALRPGGEGAIVSNQGFSRQWSFRGAPPELLAGLWPAWRVARGVVGEQAISYWPAGLTWGLMAAAIGLLALILLDIFALGKTERLPAAPAAAPHGK